MNVLIHTHEQQKIAEVVSDDVLIQSAQDALDLMYDPALDGARKIIVQKVHINPNFFRLETGLAGDIVQKFVNYGVQLAIVGNFEDTSENFKAFMRESNRGKHVCFVEDTDAAMKMLGDLLK